MKLKNIKRKRLNNKGFTLIELLAVVVILAVVMGIAMTSVLSSMNKSRGGSLSDTASVIANGFSQKYTESLVDGAPTNVYGDVLTTGYDFSTDAAYYLDTKLADEFNISSDTYVLTNSGTSTKIAGTDAATGASVSASIVTYNVSSGKFIICMVANDSGNNYVDTFAKNAATLVTVNTNFKINFTPATGKKIMYACSDGTKSW